MKRNSVYAVIMAGGGGTRFWPWSREKRPKQVLPILSARSMIWETVERIRPFVPREKIYIVTARSQVAGLRREIPQIPEENLLAEPVGRNTAPCLCLAAIHVRRKDPRGVMVVLSADHYIGNHRGFLQTLRAAVDFARKQDYLVTLGVVPTGPETGYGYIEKGRPLAKTRGLSFLQAKSFREKPSLPKARAYLRTGKYLWNSGMFIWRADVFWEAVQRHLPGLFAEMRHLEKTLGTGREKKALEAAYACCPAISVDYGIMEKAKNVALIEGQFSWNDVGSWAALGNIFAPDKNGNALIFRPRAGQGRSLLLDSSGCLVRSEEKLIALIGMKNTVVVEAGNAFLVCPRDRSQDVRRVLEELKVRGWKEYL
jgi:mannose-1-phosphate guanylyltransferase